MQEQTCELMENHVKINKALIALEGTLKHVIELRNRITGEEPVPSTGYQAEVELISLSRILVSTPNRIQINCEKITKTIDEISVLLFNGIDNEEWIVHGQEPNENQ